MIKNTINLIEEQIRKEIKVNPSTGNGICSLAGVARLTGVNESSLRAGLEKPTKLTKFLATQGFSGLECVRFSQRGIPDVAVAAVPAIIEYYAFEAGINSTKQATLTYRAFARIGYSHLRIRAK